MRYSDILPDGILWHDGLMLSANHFKEMEQRVEGLFHSYLKSMAPYYRTHSE